MAVFKGLLLALVKLVRELAGCSFSKFLEVFELWRWRKRCVGWCSNATRLSDARTPNNPKP